MPELRGLCDRASVWLRILQVVRMAYKGTNEEGEEFTGGKPSPEEEANSDDDCMKWDPEQMPLEHMD